MSNKKGYGEHVGAWINLHACLYYTCISRSTTHIIAYDEQRIDFSPPSGDPSSYSDPSSGGPSSNASSILFIGFFDDFFDGFFGSFLGLFSEIV